jgi:hypothetical protein
MKQYPEQAYKEIWESVKKYELSRLHLVKILARIDMGKPPRGSVVPSCDD